MTLRCVIVDDSAAVLRAATDLLEGQGIDVVGVATTGEEALRLMDEREPDVMLIDVDLGDESGLDLSRTVARAGRRSIVMSTRDEGDFADRIAASGAAGFLPKSDLSATAIRRILASAHEEGRS